MKDASIHILGRCSPSGRRRAALLSQYEFFHLTMYGFDLSANITFRFCTYRNPMLASFLLKTLALTGGNIGPEGSVVRYLSRFPEVFTRPLRWTSAILLEMTSHSVPSRADIKGGPLYRVHLGVSLSYLFSTGISFWAHETAKRREYRLRIPPPALSY